MSLTTYRAYTMAEALTAVKRDLGPDAIILNTRSVSKGRFLGLSRGTIVEVVAMRAEDARKSNVARSSGVNAAVAKAKAAKRPLNSAAVKGYVATTAARDLRATQAIDAKTTSGKPASAMEAKPVETREKPQDDSIEVTAADREKTRDFAREMLNKLEAEAKVAASTVSVETANVISRDEPAPVAAAAASSVARRFVLMDETAETAKPTAEDIAAVTTATIESPRISQRSDETFENLQTELTAIKQMVGHVMARQRSVAGPTNEAVGPSMPAQLFDYYLKLIAQDLSEELADQIINNVRDDLKTIDMQDDAHVRATVLRHLADYIPCVEETETGAAMTCETPLDDRPLTIALVGPTGVGKTTTVAKLAASYKLRQGKKVGLITCDTYRIAAVDQLRTYANIIGLPLEVVLTPADMERAVWRLRDCEVLLIDTAGRSQKDSARIEELRQFIEAADPHEVHLVLSSTASEKVLVQEAEAFANVGVDKLVFTKLDEAVSFGMLITVARRLGAQLSFLTTGQEVPDHLEVGRPTRLAELILGGAVHQ